LTPVAAKGLDVVMHRSRSRWWSFLMLALMLALVLGAGCSDSPGPGSDRTPNEPSTSESPRAVIERPAVSTTFRALPTTVASRFEFVDYHVSEGTAGVTRTLKVWPDGRATCSRASTRADFSVPSSTVGELRSALEAANLAALPPVNGTQTPESTVSRVIYGGQAVRFVIGSMPPSLGPAVALLDRVLARGCP
jgi:hypothetical protein